MLIAANETGYGNLVRLVSRAYLENGPGDPVNASLDWVAGLAEGLICLTGGPRGAIGMALKTDHAPLAESRLLSLKSIFGDRLYVELERAEGYDRVVEAKTIDLAYQPRVAAGRHQRGVFPGAGRLRSA